MKSKFFPVENLWWRTGFKSRFFPFLKRPFRKSLYDNWHVEWDRASRSPKNFLEECLDVAQKIGERASQPIRVLLSGGKDSEVVARSFLKVGVPFDCVILRVENDLNTFDISYGISFCEKFKIKYEIIDIAFFEYYVRNLELHKHYSQFDKTTEYASWFWATDKLEGTVVCGNGMLLDFMFKLKTGLTKVKKFSRGNDAHHYDYVYDSRLVDDLRGKYEVTPWFLTFSEMDGDCWDNYNTFLKKEWVTKFFAYTPEIALAQLLDPLVMRTMGNSQYGHFSMTVLKSDFYKQYFPDIIPRPKYSGNEKLAKTRECGLYAERTKNDRISTEELKSYRILHQDLVNSLLPAQ